MRVRFKSKPTVVEFTHKFNVHGLGEVLVGFVDGDMDSVYIRDLEVFIEALDEWKSMSKAFEDSDIITDNYNTYIFEPKNDEDRKRGYTL